MKLRDVPDPVWYGLLAVAAAGGVWWLTKKAGDTLSTSLNPVSDKNVAYKGVNALGQAAGLIGKDDTLGTALYGAVDTVKGWFGYGDPDPTASTGGASGSWASPAPSSSGYSYGTAGPGGIPWRYDAKPLPDIFNFSLDYIL